MVVDLLTPARAQLEYLADVLDCSVWPYSPALLELYMLMTSSGHTPNAAYGAGRIFALVSFLASYRCTLRQKTGSVW